MSYAEVISPIAGIIAMMNAEDGAMVERGEVICQVECMKSFFEVVAPESGVVRYNVQIGESVGQDDVIAIVEQEG